MKSIFRSGMILNAVSALALWVAGPGLAQSLSAPVSNRATLPGPTAPPNPAEILSNPIPASFTSKIGFFQSEPEPGASYPRVIQLKNYAPGRGQLLATFARRGALPIYRSTDNGESWKVFSEIANLRGQPALYELPVKMGEFPAGTILAAGTSAPGADPNIQTLEVSVSTDGGKSWKYLSTVATGGVGRYDAQNRAGLSIQNPVWEPFLFADAHGRLVAYISNEGHKRDGYSQLLEHKVSTDGGRSWSDAVYDVAIGDGLTRPGMAVVTRAGTGKFFMSYEMVGMPGVALEPRTNLAYFKSSDDGVNWGDDKAYGTFIQDRFRQYPNGTPYIVWSPWGGPNGTLIASGRSIMRYEIGRTGNGVMVNRDNGKGLWTLIETPIVYNPALDGYSQTMIPLGDGREILQLVSVNNRIAYAKFLLPEKLPEYGFPWDAPKK